MKLYPIESGNFKLDGGAMFGVVPKVIWQRTNPSDENNRIEMATRCLLIEDSKKLILIDCGLGNKQDDKFFSHYDLFGDYSLEKSLAKYGFIPDDITDVFFTHLHFDHCGGAVKWNKNKTRYELLFKNAIYWSNENHWLWATKPNIREKASFLSENILPIKELGQLQFLDIPLDNYQINSPLPFDIIFVDGHTEKMMLPLIKYQDKTIVFVADLFPTFSHIPIPYVMSYDTRPLITMDEKEKFLQKAMDNNYILFFEHDCKHHLANLKNTDKGIRINNTFTFNDIFGY